MTQRRSSLSGDAMEPQRGGSPEVHSQFDLAPEVTVDRTALRLPDDLPIDTWRGIGEKIVSVVNSSAWWIGDWIVFGQHKYGDRYKRAIARTELDYQTLRNYSWVARRFPPEERRPELSFQHHVEVAALESGERLHWLDLATKFAWSRNELRRQIRNSESTDEVPLPPDGRLHLRLNPDKIRRWQEAAHRNRLPLADWITAVLDNAVLDT